jgi:hypothetical protein
MLIQKPIKNIGFSINTGCDSFLPFSRHFTSKRIGFPAFIERCGTQARAVCRRRVWDPLLRIPLPSALRRLKAPATAAPLLSAATFDKCGKADAFRREMAPEI